MTKKAKIPEEYKKHYEKKKKRATKWAEATRELGAGMSPSEIAAKERITKVVKKAGGPRAAIKKGVANVRAVNKYFGEKWKTEDLKKDIKKMKRKSRLKQLQAKGRKLRAKK